MVKICAVKNCTSRRSNNTLVKDVSSLSFFLAKSQTKLEEWSRALRMRLKPTDFICQLHFKEEDLQISYKLDKGNNDQYCNFKKKLLKRNALPTIEHQLHLNLEVEEEQYRRKHRRRKDIKSEENEGILKVQQLISNLKENYSALPENWLFVEKSNEIGFMRVDPMSMKIKNHIILNADFTVTAIGANNKKIFMRDQISSPDDIYDYLKYVEKWAQCVGTLLDRQSYAKNCRGVITDDDSCKRNQFYPRCNPCRFLRQALLYGRKPYGKKSVEESAARSNENNLTECEHIKTIDKTKLTEEHETEIDSDYLDQSEIRRKTQDQLDSKKNDRLKQKLRGVWSSAKFCGLCLESNGSFHPIDTELIINRQKFSKCLHDIINYIFHEDIKHFTSSSYICERCTEKTIQTYIFIHNAKEVSKIMNNCVSDVYSKVIDLNDQLSPTIDYGDANVMIVLENNTDLYKNIIDTRINEVVHITKPIHMKIDKKIAENFQKNTADNEVKKEKIDTVNTESMPSAINNTLKVEEMDIDGDVAKKNPILTTDTDKEEPKITNVTITEILKTISMERSRPKIDFKLINLIPMAPCIPMKTVNTKMNQFPTAIPVPVIKRVARHDNRITNQATPVSPEIMNRLPKLVITKTIDSVSENNVINTVTDMTMRKDNIIIKRNILSTSSGSIHIPSTYKATDESH